MSFCGKCGCQLNDDNQFCNNCGAPVPKELTESKSFVPKQVRSNNSSIREYPQSASTSGSYSLPNTSSEVSTMPETHETRKEVFSGVIHKCPHCGTVLEGFVVECPGCGYELRSEDSLSSVEKLSQRLENLESQRKTPTAKESLKDAFLGSFAPVDTVYAAKATLITSYPIPNTKEEILEFVILASSNINPEAIAGATKGDANLVQLYQKMLVEQNAWVSKMEQAYRKAQLSFPTDPVFLQVQQIYEAKTTEIKNLKKKKTRSTALLLGGVFLVLALLIGLCIWGLKSSLKAEKKEKEKEIERLESIVDEIEDDIADGNYSSAKRKAQRLHYDGPDDNVRSDEKAWDETREGYIAEIEKLEQEAKS